MRFVLLLLLTINAFAASPRQKTVLDPKETPITIYDDRDSTGKFVFIVVGNCKVRVPARWVRGNDAELKAMVDEILKTCYPENK